MRLSRTWLAVALVALPICVSAVPAVLIVHLKPQKGLPFDTPICDALANELQNGGRTVPIVWGLSDPIYRAAVSEGKIRSGNETPTLGEALGVAGKLRAKYVLATDVRAGDGELLSAAYLYKDGKLIWKDPEYDLGPALANLKEKLRKKEMTREEYDAAVVKAGFRTSKIQLGSRFGVDDTVRSLARTWVEMMNTGPFQSLPRQPERLTPDPGRGDSPVAAGGATPPVKPVDDKRWTADATAALKAGDTTRAVNLLRDAVDSAPMDVSRRLFLVKTLMQVGQPDVAAREARRAAELMPEHVEFRATAARAWIQAGNADEAQADLNEAVSRAPDSADTRLLLAEVAISKGDFGPAIDHLSKAISVGPTGDAYYLRGLAHAMAGDLDLAAADIKKAIESGLSQDPQEAEARYRLVAAMFDDGLVSIGIEIRTLHSRAQVQRTDKEVRQSYDDLLKRVSGRSQFISELPVPAEHAASHNRRVLAYKLLCQCLSDLESFLSNGDGDVLTDSRINLGEALKQGASARLKFREEQQGIKKSDGKPG